MKLLDLEGAENTSMIIASILLVLHMHIGPTRVLKDGAPNVEFDTNGRLHTGSTDLDWDDSAKIEEAIFMDEDNKDREEDPWERNRQLKKEKQRQNRVAKVKTRLAKAKTR